MVYMGCQSALFVLMLYIQFWTNVGASGPCALLEPRADALCIPLASINRAFRDARQYFGLKYPISFPPHKTQHHLDEVDRLGMVLTQTTKYIAKEFEISQEHIEKLLPELDLELTDVWSFCPLQFRNRKDCKLSIYRELNGRCNNLNFPEWGSTFTPFRYLIPADRPDGIEYPKDPDATYLPPARIVSSKMHRDNVVHDHTVTVMLIAWGQLVDHDITLTAETKDPYTKRDPDCCKYLQDGPDAKLHHNCFPIQIANHDEFYYGHHQHCMNFARSVSGVRPNCRLGPRTALNSISSFLDANFVYGSEEYLSTKLRTGKYGMLDSLPEFHKIGLKNLLPLKLDHPDEGCIRPNEHVYCFLAGDHRVNEQLVLTVLHTVFMREHNRIAWQLAKINLHWDDERLFQETRRIVIAITQHITYEEFLPMVLGKRLLNEFQISVDKEGKFWNGYDPNLDPSATEGFITAAFRFGHSLLPHRIERWSVAHKFIDSKELSRLIRQPFDILKPGYVDTYLLGMVNQLAQAMDEGVTEQVTTLLFKKPHKHFGMDLAAINIQRGRDHAIRGYTEYRKMCGLSTVQHWEDLVGIMRNDTVAMYKTIYRAPQDIDLWSGGVSEIPIHGSLVGPTFGCIIAKQFQALRYGDRHWYEVPNLPSSFTSEQLEEIKKIKLSRLLCDNGDYIKTIQVYAMVLADPHRNPRVPCQGHVLPRIDLSKWHESNPHQEPHQKHNSIYKHSEGYTTLHAPKFDPNYLQGPHGEYQQPPLNSAYNLSHETTNYAENTPSYPEVEANNDIEDDPKNAYLVLLDSSNRGRDIPLNDVIRQEHIYDNDHQTRFEEQNYQTTFEPNHPPPGSGQNGPEILENLEAPPVDDYIEGEEEEYDHENQQSPPQFPQPLSNTYRQPEPEPYLPPPSRMPQHFNRPVLPKQRRVNPFPDSPFPGMGGIFSPNPGYLVKQRFSIPRFPFIG
ncbi:peroxidase isoform X2 [Folsomia candida]|uniref:peroxidase isoform X2 n=1 Tax=Folsomia candida TaxID=158441 RepID=UPI001604E35C|nr:peroxidase isoform X2 [Folsomia candida]